MINNAIHNRKISLNFPSDKLTDKLFKKLKKYGATVIYDFVSRETCGELLVEANKHKSNTTRYSKQYTPFNMTEVKNDEPNKEPFHSKFSLELCDYSQINENSIFRSVYDSNDMLSFIRSITHISNLRRYNDGGAALNLTFMREGDCVGWHFDTCDIVVALILQMPSAGGDLIFSRNNRSDYTNSEDHVFDGRHSLHQVRVVEGSLERVVALMSYDRSQISRVTASLNETRYVASRKSS